MAADAEQLKTEIDSLNALVQQLMSEIAKLSAKTTAMEASLAEVEAEVSEFDEAPQGETIKEITTGSGMQAQRTGSHVHLTAEGGGGDLGVGAKYQVWLTNVTSEADPTLIGKWDWPRIHYKPDV